MTTMLASGIHQQQAAPDKGGRVIVGNTSGHGMKRVVHGSVSAYCSAHLPGQVSVITAGVPGRTGPGGGYLAGCPVGGDF